MDPVPEGQHVRVVARFHEADRNCFLKLVHPFRGTTVDYAVRSLFMASTAPGRPPAPLAFLELAPGLPAPPGSVPVWTVVEVAHADLVRTLWVQEAMAVRPIVDRIIAQREQAPYPQMALAFGEFPFWRNPACGAPGNFSLVCLRCMAPRADHQPCPRCGLVA
jgi:hypothetical protein